MRKFVSLFIEHFPFQLVWPLFATACGPHQWALPILVGLVIVCVYQLNGNQSNYCFSLLQFFLCQSGHQFPSMAIHVYVNNYIVCFLILSDYNISSSVLVIFDGCLGLVVVNCSHDELTMCIHFNKWKPQNTDFFF